MPPIVGVASEECFCDWWDAGACSMTQVITEVECILHDVSSSLPEIPRQSELYCWRWWCWVGCLVWGALVCLPYPKRGVFLWLIGFFVQGHVRLAASGEGWFCMWLSCRVWLGLGALRLTMDCCHQAGWGDFVVTVLMWLFGWYMSWEELGISVVWRLGGQLVVLTIGSVCGEMARGG